MKELEAFKKKFKNYFKDRLLYDAQYQNIFDYYNKIGEEEAIMHTAEMLHEINTGQRQRDFVFQFINNCEKKRGVYKVTFDSEKFYIGRAKYIKTRFSQHSTEIKSFFKTGNYILEGYWFKVFEHLKENQLRYYFQVELLKECETNEDLFNGEQEWLDFYKDDPNCLNVGFKATKPHNEIEETLEEQKKRNLPAIIAYRTQQKYKRNSK